MAMMDAWIMMTKSECLTLIITILSGLAILAAFVWFLVGIYLDIRLLEFRIDVLTNDVRREAGTIYLPSEMPERTPVDSTGVNQ